MPLCVPVHTGVSFTLQCGAFLPGCGEADQATSFQPPYPLPSWVGGNGHLSHFDYKTFTYNTSCNLHNSHVRLALFLIPTLPRGKLGFPEVSDSVLVELSVRVWIPTPLTVFPRPRPCSSYHTKVNGVPRARPRGTTF